MANYLKINDYFRIKCEFRTKTIVDKSFELCHSLIGYKMLTRRWCEKKEDHHWYSMYNGIDRIGRFFAVPRSLIFPGAIDSIFVRHYNGTEYVDITDRLTQNEWHQLLKNTSCRRIIGANYRYFEKDVVYEITIIYDIWGPCDILLGGAEITENSLINKATIFGGDNMFPTLRYKVTDPERVINRISTMLPK